MPIYEYACSKCEKVTDVFQKMSDPAPEKCEQCGASGTLTRVVSRTSFVLKGGGWYSDLYGSSKKGSAATPAKDAPAPAAASKEATTSSSASPTAASSTSSTAPAPAPAPKPKAANE